MDLPALLRRTLAVLSLGGLLATALVLVSAAATYPSLLVPARYGGFPGWLRGPLDGFGYFLFPSDFATVALVMTGCYLVALACASVLGARWTLGAIVEIGRAHV